MKTVVAVASLCAAYVSFAAIYVDVNSAALTPDGSEGAPFRTIQEGVSAVKTAGDEVLVAPGEYPLTATLSVTGTKKMHIRATGANPRDTVVYAVNGDIRCLTMSSVPQNVTYSFLPTGAAAFENAEYHNVVGVADPRFADAANGDYRLKSNSPCRGAGYVDDWMNSATDHGTGRIVETAVGTYGVSLAYEKARPFVEDGKANIGCFGAFSRTGLAVFVR